MQRRKIAHERFVENRHHQFEIEMQGAAVDVEGSENCEFVVYRNGFGVQKSPFIEKDPHAGLKKIVEIAAHGPARGRVVAFLRNNEGYGNAAQHCVKERADH